MQQLQNIASMKMKELIWSLEESKCREKMALMEQGRVIPNEYGNRKERRAAQAIARKKEPA